MDNDAGLKRALTAGDRVILSTGATATVRRSYPQGYVGDVEIVLDGAHETERTSGLTLPDESAPQAQPELGEPIAAQTDEVSEIRAPSRRMED